MAPALTKILKDGHGIHLSSPHASSRMDSDGRALHSAELESPMKLTDDLQKMWLNLSLFPSLDSCLPLSPFDTPSSPVRSPCLQASTSQCETVPLPGPVSLLSFLSFNKGRRNSHRVAGVFPGVPDMFLAPQHNRQEPRLLHGRSAAPQRGPDGGDVHRSPLILTSVPPSYSHGEINSQGYTAFFAPPPTQTQGKVVGTVCPPPPSLMQPCSSRVTLLFHSERPPARAELEAVLKEQLSRQAALQSRAQRLQRRLQSLLGEHAVLHCNQQLEGLQRHRQLCGGVDSIQADRVGSKPHCSWLESSSASCSSTELREFSRSSQAVLRGLQEALDSEATASSSSDEEQEEEKIHSRSKTSHVSSSSSSSSSSRERRWLEERAELGSRWSWLQLRLAVLEGRIQQLGELHKHIRSTKGGVVLAESQPLTDGQIQQTLLREMDGLSCTASDTDTEHCSPTRLLHNIERQSAQLNQIVNSLSVSFSPLSKQPHTWEGKRTFTSGQKGDNAFVPGSSKRRRLGTRGLLKSNVPYGCARTRTLVTYHKPKLFTFNTCNPSSLQDLGRSTATLSSSLSSSSSSCCSSCDPRVLCSDRDCCTSRALSSRTLNPTPHPVSSLSFDTPLSQHLKKVPAREEWSQRPLVINVQPSTPVLNRRSSTPRHRRHTKKQHARHHKRRVLDLSPIRMAASAQHSGANQMKKKRRRIHRLKEDEEDVLYQLCDPDSSDEVLKESYTQISHKQTSQGFVRKRQGESVYDINNFVIPMSRAKVEKPQYKDILTPSWRSVDDLFLMSSEADKEEDKKEGQMEDLSDEAFAQKHLDLEEREKLRRLSWGKRKCCMSPKRSGSRLSGSGGGMCTSGEESSVEWSCAQLDTDEQQSSAEWLQPQSPWERRVFPLDKDPEDALLSDDLEKVPSELS